MTFADDVTVDTPEAWWDTRQAAGASQPDRAGNGHIGTIANAPTLDTDGLHFDGIDQGVEGDDVVIGAGTLSAFTLESVFEHDGDFGVVLDEPIALLRDAISDSTVVLSGGSTDNLSGSYGPTGGSVGVSGIDTAPLHHLLLRFDGAELTIWLDGVMDPTTASTSPIAIDDCKLYIGTDGTGTTDFYGPYAGLVRHAIYYDHDISDARIIAHALSALTDDPPPTPPVPPPPVISEQSDAQIIELQYGGQRQDRFTFPLLNPDRSPLGASLDAHADSAPSIQVQTQRTSFRTCSGLIVDNPPPDLNLSRVRVQPTLTLANGSQYPLGVLMFGLDARNIYATGEQWTPELFDETFLLDQDLADTWSLGAGGSVLGLFTALADEVLGPLGIPADYEIDDVAAASPLVFKVGTSRNAALVALSALLGALPPFFDNRGTYRLKPAPAGLASDHSYEIGTRIFDATTVVSSSLYKAPNRYIVVGDDVGGTPVRGVFDLPDAAGNSFASTGQRVTAPVHTVSGVKSVELATQIAYVDALTDQTTYGTATFAAAADPRHDIFDTVTLLGVQYLETGWTLGCSSGGDMSHALSRLWA